MHYVLIILLFQARGAGTSMAEFGSQAACEQAAVEVKQAVAGDTLGSYYANVITLCEPKGP